MNQESGSNPLRVLGVDPGTRRVGYGVVEMTRSQKPRLIGCDVLRLASGSVAARLEAIYSYTSAQFERYRPAALAIEDVFHGKNFRSVLKVGQARGVIILAAQIAGIGIEEYAPRLVKKSVTGNGNADKAQVQRMVARILGAREALTSDDVADALAVAFCHSQRRRRDRLLGGEVPPSEVAAGEGQTRRRSRLQEEIRRAQRGGPATPDRRSEHQLIRRMIRTGKAVDVTPSRQRDERSSAEEKPRRECDAD